MDDAGCCDGVKSAPNSSLPKWISNYNPLDCDLYNKRMQEALAIAWEAMNKCEWHLDSEGNWCNDHLTTICVCGGVESCVKIGEAMRRIKELGE